MPNLRSSPPSPPPNGTATSPETLHDATVILDTDLASSSHKGRPPDPLATCLIARRTLITLGELTKWPEILHWGTRSRQALADWISGMLILPGNDAEAASLGGLPAAAPLGGRPPPVNDMWVAACCLTYDLPLRP
jgi:hypothetical protein